MQLVYSNELAHHGIKGQRWGVRRYQNLDGSLTEKGRKHYDVGSSVSAKYIKKNFKIGDKRINRKIAKSIASEINKRRETFDIERIKNSSESKLKKQKEESESKYEKFVNDSISGKNDKMSETSYFSKLDTLEDNSYRGNMAYALKTGDFSDFINEHYSNMPIKKAKKSNSSKRGKALVATYMMAIGGLSAAAIINAKRG